MIPMGPPEITEEDIQAVADVVRSGILSLGPKTPEFENRFKEKIGCNYATAVSSGTTGLHLTTLALNLKPKDEVITSSFSFISSANAIHYTKAKPVFADIDPLSYNIDPKEIEKKITKYTKAILPIHIFGEPCDMQPILELAEKHNLAVIEDACESIGATYKGKKVGTLGLAGVFAFYPNKQMTTAEGGMITTNDRELDEYFKSMRNQGRSDKSLQWLEHIRIGYNYRISELHAALGISQLKRLDSILEKREQNARIYTKKLKQISKVTTPTHTNGKTWFVYVIKLEKELDRNKIIKELEKRDIPTKPYLPAIHLQPAYKKEYKYQEGELPITEEVSKSTLALPFFTNITQEQIEEVVRNLQEVVQ